jgi:hypothetical protein
MAGERSVGLAGVKFALRETLHMGFFAGLKPD